MDGGLLEPADVVHHVDGLRQLDDGVDHQLPLAVPGDAPAAIHGDNRQIVGRHIDGLGALTCGVDVGVLDHQERVWNVPAGALGGEVCLEIPRLAVVHPAQAADL